jgi:hypothetical protein
VAWCIRAGLSGPFLCLRDHLLLCDQTAARGLHIGLVDELSDRELGSSINGDEEIEFALRDLHFGDVDVEEADRIGFELPPRFFVAFHLGKSADAVALQTAMQRRAR